MSRNSPLQRAKSRETLNRFWAERRSKRGRPKRFNYFNYDPAVRSAISKRYWAQDTEAVRRHKEKFRQACLEGQERYYKKARLAREEFKRAQERGFNERLAKDLKEETENYYIVAKDLLKETGVEPLPNQPIEYYRDLINFFRPRSV